VEYKSGKKDEFPACSRSSCATAGADPQSAPDDPHAQRVRLVDDLLDVSRIRDPAREARESCLACWPRAMRADKGEKSRAAGRA
jgi:hypothetical protein